MSRTRKPCEITFRCNPQMYNAIIRQAQIEHRNSGNNHGGSTIARHALRAELSRKGWNTDFLDGIAGAPPRKDGTDPFPAGWNQRGGCK